jgi:ketosteroid isomerase-like protein
MAHSQNGFTGGESAERAAVVRITASLLRAVNAADLAGVVEVWSDDGVLMPPHHPSVRGRPEIERYFSELFERTRFTFSFTASSLHISGDTAFERVEYSVSARPALGGAEAQDVGKGLHVYRREQNGLWKLAMDIWNSDVRVTAATQP